MKSCNIWLTGDCTLRCKYCYEKDIRNNNTITKQMAHKIVLLIQNENENVEYINFHGGEPLLNYEGLEYLVKELVKINEDVIFSFTTNGTVWNSKIESLLIKYKKNFETGISISIDGEKKIHDRNRYYINGSGSYDHVCKTLKEFQKNFQQIRGRMTFTPDTIEYIYESVLHLYDLDFSVIVHAFDFYDDRWNDDDIRVIHEQYEKVIRFWEKHKNVNISFADGLRFTRRELGRCKPSINIDSAGKIYPCSFVVGKKDYIIGDLDLGLLHDKIRCYEDSFCKDNGFCEQCAKKNYCESNRCKFMNKAITGDYFMPVGIACAIQNLENLLYIKYREILTD